MISLAFLLVGADDRPVIKLEDALLEGTHKRPAIVELESKDLDRKIQEMALKNLIKLEAELTAPAPMPPPQR